MNFKISLIALCAICSTVLFTSPNAAATDAKPEKTSTKTITITVKAGDTLTAIAKKHKTTYARIFDANPSISNPDMIDVGQKLRIPTKKEKLPKRFDEYQAVATTPQQPVVYSSYTASATSNVSQGYVYTGSSAGNTYYQGQCTWYVKNRRPDLPNMLGNGGQWVANAAARGLATGTTPHVGAVAEVPGHVMYVEAVNQKKGTITVSEMNYYGVGVVNQRTLAASSARYIY